VASCRNGEEAEFTNFACLLSFDSLLGEAIRLEKNITGRPLQSPIPASENVLSSLLPVEFGKPIKGKHKQE
jgi:hypothetical protein